MKSPISIIKKIVLVSFCGFVFFGFGINSVFATTALDSSFVEFPSATVFVEDSDYVIRFEIDDYTPYKYYRTINSSQSAIDISSVATYEDLGTGEGSGNLGSEIPSYIEDGYIDFRLPYNLSTWLTSGATDVYINLIDLSPVPDILRYSIHLQIVDDEFVFVPDVPFAVPDYTTHISELIPLQNATTTATTTPVTFSMTGYIATTTPWYLSYQYYFWASDNFSNFPDDADNSRIFLDHVYATTTEDFSFSYSTTTPTIGAWWVRGQILSCYGVSIFNSCNLFDTITTKNTVIHQFVVQNLTQGQLIFQSSAGMIDDAINAYTGTSTAQTLSACTFGGFDIFICIWQLIFPSDELLREDFTAFHDYVLKIFPLGYVTRFLDIVVDPTAVQPPDLSYTFGRNSPSDLEGQTFSINIFDIEKATYLNTIYADNTTVPDSVNIWDIINPYLVTVFAFGALFIIFKDLSIFNWEDFGLTPDSGPVEVFATKDVPVHDTALVQGQAREGIERARQHQHAFNNAQRAEVLRIRK